MAQNYLDAIWGHTWSLAVEEHFYLLLPIVLSLMARGRLMEPFRRLPYIFLVVAVGCLALRYWTGARYPNFDHATHYRPSHLRIDSLMCGVLLGYLHNFRPHLLRRIMNPPWRRPLSFLGILALAPAFFLRFDNPFMYTAGFTLLYIGFAILLLVAVYRETDAKPGAPGVVSRAIAGLGAYSYSIYLWHAPLAELAFRYDRNGNLYAIHAVYVAGSLIIGIGMSKLIEMPVLRLRNTVMP